MCSWHRGRARAEAEADAKSSDTSTLPPVSDAPDVDPPASGATTPGKAGTDSTTDAAATGTTDRTGLASHADGAADGDGGVQDSPPATPVPVLPDDWRKRLADAAYLLGCPAHLLREAMGDDDRLDLTALRDHLNTILQEQTS
jgi:hypothetical protein